MDKITYFPNLVEIAKVLIAETQRHEGLFFHATKTLELYAIAFPIAVLVGVFIGLAIGSSRKLGVALLPTIDFLRPIPSVAYIPILISLVGLSSLLNVLVVFLGSVWPIVINSSAGAQNVSTQYLDVAQLYESTKLERFGKVIFPASLPYITSGIRISSSIALLLTVSVELITGNHGLGFFIRFAESGMNIQRMYAGIFTAGIIGMILNMLWEDIERRVLFRDKKRDPLTH